MIVAYVSLAITTMIVIHYGFELINNEIVALKDWYYFALISSIGLTILILFYLYLLFNPLVLF